MLGLSALRIKALLAVRRTPTLDLKESLGSTQGQTLIGINISHFA